MKISLIQTRVVCHPCAKRIYDLAACSAEHLLKKLIPIALTG